MMNPTDFSKSLTAFFGSYLPGTRNLSANTILAYRDTFRLLLMFCRDQCGLSPEKLTFKALDDKMILSFLNWIQDERGCGVSTRNQRLAAVHAFFRYAQAEEPVYILTSQKILQIPFKRCERSIVQHLTPEQTKILLAQPNMSTKTGRRDATLLSILYDTGARVQELCDLRVKDVRLERPPIIMLTGKGRKTRCVPILENAVALLKSYMSENRLFENGRQDTPLFHNQRRSALTRGGVSYILQKYTDLAAEHTNMPKTLTPHILRHSKAMHLYQAGVNLIYIRDILGHVDISTTDIYARADTESKRKALESAFTSITPAEYPDWNLDENLLKFLNKL